MLFRSDQILSNFIPYTNPYVVISWKIPSDMNIKSVQELRSPVIWGGDMSMSYPTDTTGNEKYRIEASTTFVIKGWLFPKSIPKQQNVFFVTQNFKSTLLEDTFYQKYSDSITIPNSEILKTTTFSAAPILKHIYFNGYLLNRNLDFQQEEVNYPFIILGENFGQTTNILL